MNTVTYKLQENNGKLRPFIPIVVINPETGTKVNVMALVDTGADACAFPEHVASGTKHILKGVNVVNSVSSGIGGVDVSTWKHTFVIGLLDPTFQKVIKWTDRILIDCFEHNNAPPLLGTENFLKDFILSVDYPNKSLTLSWR